MTYNILIRHIYAICTTEQYSIEYTTQMTNNKARMDYKSTRYYPTDNQHKSYGDNLMSTY